MLLLTSMFLCVGCNRNMVQEKRVMEEDAESALEKKIQLPGYINDDILDYFKLTEEKLKSWNKIEQNREYNPEPVVASWTFYSQDGQINSNTQLFENSSVEVRVCKPTEYTIKHPGIFKDLTGHESAFVYALVMKAEDVFRGFSELDTWETVEKCLQKLDGVEDFDIASYYVFRDDAIYIHRLQFIYKGYLFCAEIQAEDPRDVNKAAFFNPKSSVYISCLNQGADYTELTGDYIQVAESCNFGLLDPLEAVPEFGSLLHLEKHDESYIATRYTYDESGEWIQDKEWGIEDVPIGSELQFINSGNGDEWASYYPGKDWIYLSIRPNMESMDLLSDGTGVTYKKVNRKISYQESVKK